MNLEEDGPLSVLKGSNDNRITEFLDLPSLNKPHKTQCFRNSFCCYRYYTLASYSVFCSRTPVKMWGSTYSVDSFGKSSCD